MEEDFYKLNPIILQINKLQIQPVHNNNNQPILLNNKKHKILQILLVVTLEVVVIQLKQLL